MNDQVKSKDRVAEHGEVFTADVQVNAMLDLVKSETERIDSRFLEPACGEGAFLIKILERKLSVVDSKYRRNPIDYEKFSIVALCSLYGVDLLEDNVQSCRDHLYECWKNEYIKHMKTSARDEVCEAARYILNTNIICGNALSMMKVDSFQKDIPASYVTFAEWEFIMDSLVKRRDYRLDVLLKDDQNKCYSTLEDQFSLFDDDPMAQNNWIEDPDDPKKVIPAPIRVYKPVNYWEVQNNE